MRNVLLSIFIFSTLHSANAVIDSSAATTINKAKELLFAQAKESMNPAYLDTFVDSIIESIKFHDDRDFLLKYVNNECQISADYSFDGRGLLYITIFFTSGLKGLKIQHPKQQQ